MDHLNWELSVLSKAVAYHNLSGAAQHVGLSQPQLSRIIAKLESQLGVTLLDREARRKSAWTITASRVAELYGQTVRGFNGELQKLIEGVHLSEIRVGTLEGLIDVAIRCAKFCFDQPSIKLIELSVLDLNDLEEQFYKGKIDLAFTAREPGRKKFKFVRRVGYQTLDLIENGTPNIQVVSSYEFASQAALALKGNTSADLPGQKLLVSNSLSVRKNWISRFGGSGIIPSPLKKDKPLKSEKEVPVILLGSEDLPTHFWQKLTNFKV